MLTCSMMRFLSFLLLGRCVVWRIQSCGGPLSVCEVLVTSDVCVVVVVTVMYVLLFVSEVSTLRV